jgi:hypothetical protein
MPLTEATMTAHRQIVLSEWWRGRTQPVTDDWDTKGCHMNATHRVPATVEYAQWRPVSSTEQVDKDKGEDGNGDNEDGGGANTPTCRDELCSIDLVPSQKIATTASEHYQRPSNDEDGRKIRDSPGPGDQVAIDTDELSRGQAQHNHPESGSEPGQKCSLIGQMGTRSAVRIHVATHLP